MTTRSCALKRMTWAIDAKAVACGLDPLSAAALASMPLSDRREEPNLPLHCREDKGPFYETDAVNACVRDLLAVPCPSVNAYPNTTPYRADLFVSLALVLGSSCDMKDTWFFEHIRYPVEGRVL